MDTICREAWNEGVVLCGMSAAANCWFESCVTDSVPGALTALPALGFLPGSFCPRYDAETGRRPSYHRLIAERRIADGIAADDGIAIHFIDGQLHATLGSLPDAEAYAVKREGDGVAEGPLPIQMIA